MHIKSISLEGFKSYRDSTIALDPHSNIIVGRNGSGKSNFFDAIRFVFGDDRGGDIRADSRTGLLHEGTEKVIQGHVEVVLDNSDSRLPVDADEVVLRRSVGLKKDEYFLNMKKVQKQDFTNILESAGFSKSNPYYIVAQGRVDALAKMSEGQRLQVLKDVAGTQVYEDRRKESLGILKDTDEKREKINEVITSIESRLAELESEQKELAEYHRLERSRRALEYCLYSAEELRAAEAVKELEEEHRASGDSEKAKQDAADIDAQLRKLDEHLAKLKSEAAEAEAAQKAAEASLPKLTAKKVKLQGSVDRLAGEAAKDAKTAEEARRELKEVEAQIDAKRAELDDKLAPAYVAAQKTHDTAASAVAGLQARYEALLDRAGRSGQFKSKKERDSYLNDHIKDARGTAATLQSKVTKAEKETSAASEAAKKAASEVDKLEKAGRDKAAEAEALAGQVEAAAEERRKASAAAHDAKRNLDAVEKTCSELSAAGDTCEKQLYANMPLNLRRGLEEVRAISEESHPNFIAGIHGPLFDLFKPQHERYNIAVEAVAGPDLFNVVVDDEKVAAKIVAHLQSRKAGRVTLVPLNRLKETKAEYPADKDDCRPLIKYLEFDPTYAKVVQQSFARALLCRTTKVAAGYAASHALTCVTLDGDVANKRGALQGGYVDQSTTRLKSVAGMYEARGKLEDAKEHRAQLEAAVTAADQQSSAVQGRILELEDRKRKLRDDASRLMQDAERRRSDIANSTRIADAAKADAALAGQQLKALEAKMSAWQAELGTELTSKLSPGESAELESISKQLEDGQKQLQSARSALDESHRAKASVESQLNDNLLRRAKELKDRISKASGASGAAAAGAAAADRQDALAHAKRELQDASTAEADAKQRLDTAASTAASKSEAAGKAASEVDALRLKAEKMRKELSEETLKEEKFLEKKRLAIQKREDARAKIRDLGTVPTAELEQHQHKKRNALAKELGEVRGELEKYGHVNKKAVDQYETFNEQRDHLNSRKKELDKGDESIRDLISTLDQRKDEAIMRTFKGVQKHFKEIFGELAPKGSASLVMKTNLDNDSDDEMEDEEKPKSAKKKAKQQDDGSAVERFKGLAIKASFNDAGETKDINSLSGGQKTLVALALIFAIQRADPAPFYVFDEIDSALDSIHRAAVGALVKRQAYSTENPAQFITSTFSPEMLDFADKFFGVSLLHKVSSVSQLEKEEAVAFIHAMQQEEQQKQKLGSASKANVDSDTKKKMRTDA